MTKLSVYSIIMLTPFLACGLFSCFSAKETKESNSSLQGMYLGTIPAADCPGIDIELTLAANSKYTLAYAYRDRQGVFISSGSFELNGEKLRLLGEDKYNSFENYLVRNDKLILLPPTGEIPSDTKYTISKSGLKVSMAQIVDKYWKLIELNGKPIDYTKNPNLNTMARMTLKPDGTLSGNASCNSFNGIFTFHGGRVRFSRIIITKKMCLDMSVEDEFMKVLQQADSYIIDGQYLILNRARMAPLARFEAVYM